MINFYADRGEMLPCSLSELYERVRDFFVYEDRGEVAGTCALHVSWEDLGEIRSLAVKEPYVRHGIGTRLARACLEEAAALGIKKIFALTYKPAFFRRLGFQVIDKSKLPQKIWSDCVKCVKFPECDETAVILERE
ncbi:MAG: N-acetyltransferase [candidate division NC10 bacterium]|nr:N-acetyltransferase [candidate division NC10 bacterium]